MPPPNRCRARRRSPARAFRRGETTASWSVRRSLRRLRVRHVAAAEAAHADIGLLGMAGEALQNAKPRADFAYLGAGFVGEHTLVSAGLHELADPQTAG